MCIKEFAFLLLISIVIFISSLFISDLQESVSRCRSQLKASRRLPNKSTYSEQYFRERSLEQLANQMEELYENRKFSDITVNVRGREFQAHKTILAAGSSFFDAIFHNVSSSKVETNQIKVDDVEPEVFHEILRFIYTGRVSTFAMKNMTVEMLVVAKKFSMDRLRDGCETQLIHRMSPENCLQLLLITDEQHPAFYLREYAVEFLYEYSNEVTDDWEKAEKDHPQKCFSILKELAQY